MSDTNWKVLGPALLVFTAVAAGGGFMLGRRTPARAAVADSAAATPSGDSVAIAKALYAHCRSLGGDAKTDCYAKTLDSLASAGQVRTAMGTLLQLGNLDVDAKRDGHVYAHGIGIAAGKRGGDIAKTFAMCDESNQSGCYHGVIQAYFAAAKTIGPNEVNSLCDGFRGENADRWLRFQCVHGTGHGLEMIYGHDLPKALASCDYLADEWDRRSCYGGAFMENIVNVQMPHHPAHDLHASGEMHMPGMDMGTPSTFKAIDPKDPLYPCSIMADKYLVSCYEMQTSVMLYENGGNIGKAAKGCDTAPAKMRYVCYQSLGRDISSYALQDYKKSIDYCSLGNRAYQPWCYVGLVKNFVDLEAKPDDGLNFCKALSGDANKLKCYEAVGEQIATLRSDQAERRSMCAPSEPNYLAACLFGARVELNAPSGLVALNKQAAGG